MFEKLKPFKAGLNQLNREEQAQIHMLEKNKPWLEPQKPEPQQTINEFR